MIQHKQAVSKPPRNKKLRRYTKRWLRIARLQEEAARKAGYR